ncbi:DAK2 domain-containing protein [Listeria ivanovii]|uniref:DhaL domain-containing protein n=1 Tax=Listeria ivanovii (strain ATCC BAA-678 / PAM 55) TaxID=881621 RepID=G2ZBX8_LISIP|nr:DegV family protein [Listeria ivanovii]AHI55105.1 cytochrome C5 [Listeria ivanovii WSLC3009]AIS64564.1 cytochrome C5 [Listeria ivanovii subsp. ivanovii]MBC1758765.1 DegV family EDD domain-containing protein [Listeria ivanovii]MBK3913623.1 DegV family EDD domain-containing protein [Listeria ivanovii subsp. ivanovii]MBK3920259.1 DegV family EDD domain-containing protein [Listeria ivanovii subsp. ivanovii]
MTEVGNKRLLQGMLNGAREVISKKDELNRINVFPVADGDTGSNLASLMQAIIDNVAHKEYSTKELLDEVASAALIGARGNSGMIFAQYLNAVAESYHHLESTVEELVQAFQKAVNKAYEALLDPKEGTILSVMSAWSEALAENYTKEQSLHYSLLNAQAVAEKALAHTQFQMPILKKNQLVDSGAKGFYYFIVGLTNAYCEKVAVMTEVVESDQIIIEHLETTEPRYRYCSEFIIKDPTVTKQTIQTALAIKGDSLVIACNEAQIKLHIHTNEPKEVLTILAKYGTMTYQKVDDMSLQYHVTKKPRAKIAIVTDSIADLPEEFLLTHQIHVLPMNILTEDENFLDKLTAGPVMIKEKLAQKTKMSTAQPTIHSVDALLSFLENKYEHVLVITVSAQLSGTYQLIKQRIKDKKLSSDWIQVIDSRLNSVAEGLLVKQAVELVETGSSFASVMRKMEQVASRSFIYVAVADLSPMVESGRIPRFLGKLAQKMSLYPIVSLDEVGSGKLIGVSFSQKQSMKKIIKKVSKIHQENPLLDLAVAHVCSAEIAHDWSTQLKKKIGQMSYVVDSSAAIAISAGIGSVAVAGIKKEGAL